MIPDSGWAPFTALCFSSLAIVAKLSFSPYLPNSPLSPTFMGPRHCFVFFLIGDCGKIVIFAIFAKFANIFSFLPFLLLCAFLDMSQNTTYADKSRKRTRTRTPIRCPQGLKYLPLSGQCTISRKFLTKLVRF